MRSVSVLTLLLASIYSFSQPLTCSGTSTPCSCNGICDGTITINASGGLPPYTGTGTQTGLCAATYVVAVTDANNTTCFVSVTVTEPPQLITYSNLTPGMCWYICDASIAGGATGGTPPYAYLWSPGGWTTQNISNLCLGCYTLIVTDANGCSATQQTCITTPTQIIPNCISADANCYGACNGSASVNPTGGTPPYTYLWTPGNQSTQTISALCAGTYTVTITDANGCTRTCIDTIAEPPMLVTTSSGMNATCQSCCDGGAAGSHTGGIPPYTYIWSPGGATSSIVSGLCPGSYTFCVTDGSGCMMCDTAIVNFPGGISDLTPGQLMVFPNPSDGLFTIDLPGRDEFTIEVINSLGMRVYSDQNTLQKTLDLEFLPPGIYQLILTSGKHVFYSRCLIDPK